MTLKDYKILAEALRRARETVATHEALQGVNIATNAIIDVLKQDNPRFDEGLFYAIVRGEEL